MDQFFSQLSPMLWSKQSKFYSTNSGIYIGEGSAYLVDPGMAPDELESIAQFLVEHQLTPRQLILTHSHWDHLLGPIRFPNVSIITQANYRRIFNDFRESYIRQRVSRWHTKYDVPLVNPFVVPTPDDTFTDMTILTDKRIELHLCYAPGHTDDLLVIYQPEYATLWASDMLSDIEIPFIWYSIDAYQNTLVTLSKWDIEILVPGHGSCATNSSEVQNRISEDLAYVKELRDRIITAINAGKTLNETLEFCTQMHYRNLDENADSHLLNVENGYIEFGGETDQEEIGWEQLRLDSI